MSYLNYLSFEITLIISSMLFMVGKVIELVYGIITIRNRAKNDAKLTDDFRILMNAWLKNIQRDLDERNFDDDYDNDDDSNIDCGK